MSLIECRDLSFAYDGVTVVHGLNFSVQQGDYLCIIGENGAGKSTLMKGLLRLKRPSHGSIEMGEGLRAGEIGYLPQQTPVQKDFPASVREVVLSGNLSRAGWRPFYTRAEKERAQETMRELEIESLQNRCYRDLSGGQQQRVLLARALCATSKLILLDEPVAGLDPIVTRSMYELIARINRERGITVLMVSHDLQAAMKYATHILHLGRDRQLFYGTVEKYRRSAAYHNFLGESLAKIWKHDFPDLTGRAARGADRPLPADPQALRSAAQAYAALARQQEELEQVQESSASYAAEGTAPAAEETGSQVPPAPEQPEREQSSRSAQRGGGKRRSRRAARAAAGRGEKRC